MSSGTPRQTTRVIRVDPEHPDPGAIAAAAGLLRAGWPVAFPTETVYGLGCDALDPTGIQRVFEAKGRPADNPLIVHVASVDDLSRLAREVPDLARRLAAKFWPGALTLVLRRRPAVPAEVTGGLDTVAVRMPAHAVALALIRASGTPLAAPSANVSGRPSPTTAAHVLRDLGGRIPLILDAGPTRIGLESTVLDVTASVPTILRPGGVTPEEIAEVAGDVALHAEPALLGRSPGTRYRHYQPRAEVVLVPPGTSPDRRVARYQRRGVRAGAIRRAGRSLAEYGRSLFAELRALDDAGVDVIVVEAVEEHGLGLAVMDRLRRAASRRVD
jgi:L-threonylcarbamoyladenylate synthase